MRFVFSLFLLVLISPVFSQENPEEEMVSKVKIDSLYREDQFYFGLKLNTLQNKPLGLIQNTLSLGFAFGFLRDFPINKNRTVAIAPGLGFSYNNYNQNLAITQLNQTPVYNIIDPITPYNKNKFSQFLVELPIEFRWRTSTFENHKFLRIYGGFKMGYLLYDKSIYQDAQGKIVITNNKDFNKFQYGAYISSGYNSINLYAYYGLNSLFQSAKINGQSIDINSFNIGVMFYIL